MLLANGRLERSILAESPNVMEWLLRFGWLFVTLVVVGATAILISVLLRGPLLIRRE